MFIVSTSSTLTSLVIFWLKNTVNLDPSPYVESTTILPPIISTNDLVIASPSPVPSIVVFLSSSNLLNLVNKVSICSFFIPLPVSLTVIVSLDISFSFIQVTLKSIYPFSVYLTALDSKLVIICFTLPLSPYKVSGKSIAKSLLSSISFSPILVSAKVTKLLNSSKGL